MFISKSGRLDACLEVFVTILKQTRSQQDSILELKMKIN